MTLQDMLNAMRRSGWRVGAHNDFYLSHSEQWKTFWLFTHPETSAYVEAERATDYLAVQSCMRQAGVRGS